MRHNSLIIAFDPRGTGNSGNIDINTEFLVAIPSEDSDIIASALRGGDIQIRAEGIFGIEYREQRTPASDITATGEVELFTSDVDPSQGLVVLLAELVDITGLIASGCPEAVWPEESKFIITGRGGLPPNPRQVLSSSAVQVEWVELDADALNRASVDRGARRRGSSPTRPYNTVDVNRPQTEIVEAQGWIVDANGNVTLVATAPTAMPHSSWQTPADCREVGRQ